jgi:hypothetical protein
MEADMNCPDRARDGLVHLQAAARELIQAARALLDVAEDLIDDPAAIATLVGALGAMAAPPRHRTTGSSEDDGDEDDGDPGAGAEPPTTIERITVA